MNYKLPFTFSLVITMKDFSFNSLILLQVFQEPRKANQLDAVLNEYSKNINLTASSTTGVTGSLLFSVVGELQ